MQRKGLELYPWNYSSVYPWWWYLGATGDLDLLNSATEGLLVGAVVVLQ